MRTQVAAPEREPEAPYNLAARVYGSGPRLAFASAAPALALEAPALPSRPARDEAPKAKVGLFSALADSNFRLLYLGNVAQFASMQMQLLVRGYLVFQLTGSFAALGTMALANAVPGLIFSPIGGVVADRAPKKTVIQIAQMYNVINAAVLAVLAAGLFGLHLQFWHLFLSAFLQGGVNSVMMPARQSIISDLVPRDRLMNAIAINTSGQNLMQLIGPALGGFLIAWVSPAAVFALMGAMYGLAVTFTMRLPKHPVYAFTGGAHGPRGRARGGRGAGAARDLLDGMKYVAKDPIIRLLMVVNFMIVLVAMPYTMLLPGFVKEVLGKGAFEQGIMVALSGVGALGGSLAVAASPETGRGRLMLGWGLLLGVALTGFAISTNFWITLPIMLLIGAGQAGRMSIGQVLVQSYSQDEFRGRVQSVWFMQFSLVQFGTFFVGVLAEFVGPQLAIGGLAALMAISMVLVYSFVPTMRRLD
ncbi:MAG: MFS transporter [Dehalococcoidia bacterium]